MEWCQVWARAIQWLEEVLLLHEEMWRILVYLSWHVNWWTNLANNTVLNLSVSDWESTLAYAYKQANYFQVLLSKFDALWEDAPNLTGTGIRGDKEILNLDTAAYSYSVDTPLVHSKDIDNV